MEKKIEKIFSNIIDVIKMVKDNRIDIIGINAEDTSRINEDF